MKHFDLFGDVEVSEADHSVQLAGCRAAVQSGDWKDYDRMLLELRAPVPIVSWTLERPVALPNWRGELVKIDDVLDDDADDEEDALTRQQVGWLWRALLERQKARRVAGWLVRWLGERQYVGASRLPA
jgi:hypothetical protein